MINKFYELNKYANYKQCGGESCQLPLYQGGEGGRGLRQSPTGLRCEHNSSENTADATDKKIQSTEKQRIIVRIASSAVAMKKPLSK